jgi:hypothetical protein
MASFSDLFRKRPGDSGAPANLPAARGTEAVVPSKAFPKFLSALSQQPGPAIVIDFGPVIGGNVAYLGEQLGCKLFIEDLITEVDRHRKAGTMEALPAAIENRLRQEEGSVDGILCWDFFDFLDKASSQRVARHLAKMIKPGGAIVGFFCTSGVERAPFTKFEIVDNASLRHRHHPGIGGPKHALQNRDIIKMFEGLVVSESFLLKNNTREILLRKR